jgi:uncharacterized protein (TIGR02147 family)
LENVNLPSIFGYLDYRKYLMDAFDAIKASDPKYSYRQFARDAGYGSPNFLQQLKTGFRKLNLMAMEGTVRALRLNKKEAEYLRILVSFDEARSFDEREEYYQNILRARSREAVKPIEHKQFQYFSQWYHPVVRELVVIDEFQGDAERIAAHIVPAVTAAQVEKSLTLLEELGLIQLDPTTGKWVQSESIISTSSEVTSIALKGFHKRMIQLSGESIERFTGKERDIRGLTMALSDEGYALAKAKIESLWEEVIVLAQKEKNAKKVFQVNFQLFPVSKPADKHPGKK